MKTELKISKSPDAIRILNVVSLFIVPPFKISCSQTKAQRSGFRLELRRRERNLKYPLPHGISNAADFATKWVRASARKLRLAGRQRIGYIGPVPAITANVKSGGDVQILSGATKGGAILVKSPGSDISSVADLDGKVVAIPQLGNTQHLCLLNLLEENGLSPVTEGGTVTVAAVSNADVANTMNNGDIDAALVPEPWGATLLANQAELVMDYDTIYFKGDYDVAVVVVRKDFMTEHPELVAKFLEEHEAATKRMNDSLAECLSVINQELENATGKSLNEAIITEAFTRIGVSTELNQASIEQFAVISQAQGFISELPSGDLYTY